MDAAEKRTDSSDRTGTSERTVAGEPSGRTISFRAVIALSMFTLVISMETALFTTLINGATASIERNLRHVTSEVALVTRNSVEQALINRTSHTLSMLRNTTIQRGDPFASGNTTVECSFGSLRVMRCRCSGRGVT